MIVLTAQQTANLLGQNSFSDALLAPRRLSDGQYALPESALTDPRHARWRSILVQGSIVDAGSLTFTPPVGGSTGYSVTVDGHEMYLGVGAPWYTYGTPGPRLFDIPVANLYRFECHHNNVLTSGDGGAGRRRVELLRNGDDGWADGTTVWAAWSTILTDRREGFHTDNGTIIFQMHPHYTSSGVYPVMWLGLRADTLEVRTRSSLTMTGSAVTHYSEPFDPDSGTPTNFVFQCTFGASGHLNVWKDGTQIVNVDTPIGYYDEGLSVIAFPQFGCYMNNVETVDVIYHANMEIGTTNRSTRIANPQAVTAPPTGWV